MKSGSVDIGSATQLTDKSDRIFGVGFDVGRIGVILVSGYQGLGAVQVQIYSCLVN